MNFKNPGFKASWGNNVEHKGHIVKGWVSSAQTDFYQKQAAKIKNGVIVEVGVYGGASILGIVDICIKNNNTIYAIDPWELNTNANGEDLSNKEHKLDLLTTNLKEVRVQLEKVIDDLGYKDTLSLVQSFSSTAACSFEDESIDLAFIDGNHSYDSVKEDIGLWLPKMKRGGTLWGDDYAWRSVRTAVNDFCNDNNIQFSNDGRSWYIVK